MAGSGSASTVDEERECTTESCPVPVPGFLITGGWPENSQKKVELYNPSSGNSCPLQDLQVKRKDHSSCAGLVCGGRGKRGSLSVQSCEKFNGTSVSPLPSLTLRQKRQWHLCWTLPGPGDNILLLGGLSSPTTTEIVSGSSSFLTYFLPSSDSFNLPYNTIHACGIEV